MVIDFENILDECIHRMEAGEDPNDFLFEYPEQAVEIAPLMDITRDMFLLSPQQRMQDAALTGQQRMLKKLDEIQAQQVKSKKKTLQDYWKGILAPFSQLNSSVIPKENMMYRKSLLAVTLVFVFLLFGTTISAFAAQESLPGDVFYGVKVKLEDLQVNTTWDTDSEVEKSIQYADRRIQEIAELVNRSRQADIPIGVERFEYHLREAIIALDAIAKNDPDRAQELARVLTNLLEDHAKLIAALLDSDSGANLMVLSEALSATYLSMDTVGSIAGITERDAVNNLNNEPGVNDDNISSDDGDAMNDDDYGNEVDDNDAMDDDNDNNDYGYDDDDDDASDDDDYGYDDDNDDASDDDDYGYDDDNDDASDDDYGYDDDDDDASDDDYGYDDDDDDSHHNDDDDSHHNDDDNDGHHNDDDDDRDDKGND